MRRTKLLALSGAMALLLALMAPGSPATAQTAELTVQVGEHLLVGKNCDPQTHRGCRTGESMRFLAPTLKVHKGDTLTFDFPGFHTAALLPVGADFLAFRSANTGGLGKPFSLFIPDTDDTTAEGATTAKPAVKANPSAASTSVGGVPTDCGASDNPCDYDGSEVVNSGLPPGPPPFTFTTTVNANPGESFWVICFVHTHMNLRINVVPESEATTSQAEIDSAKASMVAYDQEWAEATDAKLISKQSSHTTASGQKVYDVFAGKDSHWASLNGFYPAKTTIPKGATVRFHWSNLVYEDHTVTMPPPTAFSLFEEFFVFGCDPDGDDGTAADTPASSEGPPCEDMRQFEIDVSSRVMHGTGDGIFTGSSDIEHSGIRGAQLSNAHLDVKYAKTSTRKGWKFFCMLHPMSGRVVVK